MFTNFSKCHFRFEQPIRLSFCLNLRERCVRESCSAGFLYTFYCYRDLIVVTVQITMAHKDIYYSDKYTDDKYEYRYILVRSG